MWLNCFVTFSPNSQPENSIAKTAIIKSNAYGKVLILDDSFDHEVWNESQEERVVLLLDIWHPYLSPEDRDEVRAHFDFATSSWRTSHSPWSHIAATLHS
mmetsp:Transcript_18007/g.25235  ORF Transcript_18007/g.25235 Transcript_18007/m.25235 type:complete len:100 (+) Transcript_18007:680-979(+)